MRSERSSDKWTIYVCPVCGARSPRHREPCLSDEPATLRPDHEKVEVVPAADYRGAVAENERLREVLARIADERGGDVEHIDHAKRLARRALSSAHGGSST